MSTNPFLRQLAQQCDEDSHRWFPRTADNLFYMAASTCGEAGEMLNEVKKVERGSVTFNDDSRSKILEEAADTLVYLMNVFALCDADPLWWYNYVRRKNVARFEPNHKPIPVKDNPQA